MTAFTGDDRRLIQRAGDEATERVWADRRMQEQLAKVTAERDELQCLAKDAERYRWLRNRGRYNGFAVEQHTEHWTRAHSAASLDEALDAAMSQQPKGGAE
ncbi:hypothetical protein GN316_06510 [Xylophilus sp. Kf1]|nr:hypothetical protein [Xylophilus sp. Kf1]